MRTKDRIVKSHAIEYIETVTHSFDYTRATLRDLHKEAQKNVSMIQPTNDLIEPVLTALDIE